MADSGVSEQKRLRLQKIHDLVMGKMLIAFFKLHVFVYPYRSIKFKPLPLDSYSTAEFSIQMFC